MTQEKESKHWTGIHYYHSPRYTNRLLVIGIFGRLLHLGGSSHA